MGLGRLGKGLGLDGAAGKPVMLISGSGLASGVVSSEVGLSAGSALGSAGLPSFCFALLSDFLPRMSVVVAAATSCAGITSPSLGAAGSFEGSVAGLLFRAPLFCGMLWSR